MQQMLNTSGLVIKQRTHLGEAVLGIEARSKFDVFDIEGQPLCSAIEVGGSFIGRQMLKTMRPFSMEFYDAGQQCILRLRRPWRWYFHTLEVTDIAGNLLGKVVRKWSWLRRIYTITDAQGNELFTLFGPVFRPWTFNIIDRGTQVGSIRKKWSGLLKEAFTQADNFGVEWPAEMPAEHKALLLGAVFLIDIVHFEQKSN